MGFCVITGAQASATPCPGCPDCTKPTPWASVALANNTFPNQTSNEANPMS